jgi:hypothetical protein
MKGCLFAAWWAFCILVALAFWSFVGWLAYLLVMHLTHGGAS